MMVYARYARLAAIVGLVAAAISMQAGDTAAEDRERGLTVGLITCRAVPDTSVNWIVYSEQSFDCEFVSGRGSERYRGEAGVEFGLDLEWSRNDVLTYSVVSHARDRRIGHHALAGTYYGVKASAAIGIGFGAQVLAGSGDKGVSLQPLAIESMTGVGASVGVGYLKLEPAVEKAVPFLNSVSPASADPERR